MWPRQILFFKHEWINRYPKCISISLKTEQRLKYEYGKRCPPTKKLGFEISFSSRNGIGSGKYSVREIQVSHTPKCSPLYRPPSPPRGLRLSPSIMGFGVAQGKMHFLSTSVAKMATCELRLPVAVFPTTLWELAWQWNQRSAGQRDGVLSRKKLEPGFGLA